MKGRELKERKTRCDKKYDVDCVVDAKVYDLISKLSYACDLPIKDVCEKLCERALIERVIADDLGKLFRRDYEFSNNYIVYGDSKRKKYKKLSGVNERVCFTVYRETKDKIDDLCHALSASVRAGAGLFLSKAIYYYPVVETILAAHVPQGEKRIAQAKILMRVIWSSKAVYAE